MGEGSGAVLLAVIVGVLLTMGASWGVALALQRRMRALMAGDPPPAAGSPTVGSASGPAPGSAAASSPPAATRATGATTAIDPGLPARHRRATRRAVAAIGALGLVMGLSQSLLAHAFLYDGPWTMRRTVILGLVYAWPMVLGWALLRRWSWLRMAAGCVAWLAATGVLAMATSDASQTWAAIASWFATVVALPLAVALAIGASGRIRAVAPWLLPAGMVLAAGAVGGLNLLAAGTERAPGWLVTLTGTVGAPAVMLAAVALPAALLAWPTWRLGPWMARGWRAKRYSDLGWLLAAWWGVILLASALPAVAGRGAIGLTQLLPLAWLPLAAAWLPGRLGVPAGAPRPPTLLVLRVFQRDAAVGRLFDRVVERWRLSGNTLLIAGTDLMSRTVEPDLLFSFLDGRLAERYIADVRQLPRHAAALDLRPDPDGRHRINAWHCHDATWKPALGALLQRADVVLMDLRDLHGGNGGCLYELGELARCHHLHRVVLLHNAATDLHAARTALAGAPPERIVWLKLSWLGGRATRRILQQLMT